MLQRNRRYRVSFGNPEDIISHVLFLLGAVGIFFTDQVSHSLHIGGVFAFGVALLYFAMYFRFSGLRRQVNQLERDLHTLQEDITAAMDDAANDSISKFFNDEAPKKSDVRLQNELQIAMNERTRAFEMLSNIMKGIHDMQMTSIRNLR